MNKEASMSERRLQEEIMAAVAAQMTINVTAVLADARTITSQANTWHAAVTEALRWSDDGFYTAHGKNPIVHVFFAVMAGSRRIGDLERATVAELRADLAAGRVPTDWTEPYEGHGAPEAGPLASCYTCDAMTGDAAEAARYTTIEVETNTSYPDGQLDTVAICPACFAARK